MHDGMPYDRNQGQGQGHSREVDRQSPTGLIFSTNNAQFNEFEYHFACRRKGVHLCFITSPGKMIFAVLEL